MKKIVFVPSGGLGNRMKAISAAILLGRACGSELTVKWFQDWGMGCRFSDLFCPIALDHVSVQEGTWLDKLTTDRPRKHNLYIPALYECLRYSRRMNELDTAKGVEQQFNFATWAKGHDVWLSSYTYFMAKDIPADAFDCFRPIKALQERIDRQALRLGQKCMGVHIRRTDNAKAIADSPTEAFIERMKQESDDTIFYLATDSEDVKRQLRGVFGDSRIITSQSKADRGSVSGMQDALVELYTLGRCGHILGSSFSTFAMTAATVGRAHFECVSVSAARQ